MKNPTAIAIFITILGGLMTMCGIYGVASHEMTYTSGSNSALFGAYVMWTGICLTAIAKSNGNKLVCAISVLTEIFVSIIIFSNII